MPTSLILRKLFSRSIVLREYGVLGVGAIDDGKTIAYTGHREQDACDSAMFVKVAVSLHSLQQNTNMGSGGGKEASRS